MTHDEAKDLLKENGLTLTKFCNAIGKTTANLRMLARQNEGVIPEIYKYAIIGFIQESKA